MKESLAERCLRQSRKDEEAFLLESTVQKAKTAHCEAAFRASGDRLLSNALKWETFRVEELIGPKAEETMREVLESKEPLTEAQAWAVFPSLLDSVVVLRAFWSGVDESSKALFERLLDFKNWPEGRDLGVELYKILDGTQADFSDAFVNRFVSLDFFENDPLTPLQNLCSVFPKTHPDFFQRAKAKAASELLTAHAKLRTRPPDEAFDAALEARKFKTLLNEILGNDPHGYYLPALTRKNGPVYTELEKRFDSAFEASHRDADDRSWESLKPAYLGPVADAVRLDLAKAHGIPITPPLMPGKIPLIVTKTRGNNATVELVIPAACDSGDEGTVLPFVGKPGTDGKLTALTGPGWYYDVKDKAGVVTKEYNGLYDRESLKWDPTLRSTRLTLMIPPEDLQKAEGEGQYTLKIRCAGQDLEYEVHVPLSRYEPADGLISASETPKYDEMDADGVRRGLFVSGSNTRDAVVATKYLTEQGFKCGAEEKDLVLKDEFLKLFTLKEDAPGALDYFIKDAHANGYDHNSGIFHVPDKGSRFICRKKTKGSLGKTVTQEIIVMGATRGSAPSWTSINYEDFFKAARSSERKRELLVGNFSCSSLSKAGWEINFGRLPFLRQIPTTTSAHFHTEYYGRFCLDVDCHLAMMEGLVGGKNYKQIADEYEVFKKENVLLPDHPEYIASLIRAVGLAANPDPNKIKRKKDAPVLRELVRSRLDGLAPQGLLETDVSELEGLLSIASLRRDLPEDKRDAFAKVVPLFGQLQALRKDPSLVSELDPKLLPALVTARLPEGISHAALDQIVRSKLSSVEKTVMLADLAASVEPELAAAVLVRMGMVGHAALPELRKELKDSYSDRRKAVVWTLITHGEPSADLAEEILTGTYSGSGTDVDPLVVWAGRKLGPAADKAFIKALDDKQNTYRPHNFLHLAHVVSTEAGYRYLLKAAREETGESQAAALKGMARVSDAHLPEALELLGKAMQDDASIGGQAAALYAIIKLGPKAKPLLPILRARMFRHNPVPLDPGYPRALRSIGIDVATEADLATLLGQKPDLVYNWMDDLGPLSETFARSVDPFQKEEGRTERALVLRYLGDSGAKRLVELAQQGKQTRLLIKVLDFMGPEAAGALGYLQSRFSVGSAEDRQGAIEAVASQGPAAVEASGKLLEIARSSDTDVRKAAITALGRVGSPDPEARALVEAAFESETDPNAKAFLAEGLLRMKGPKAADADKWLRQKLRTALGFDQAQALTTPGYSSSYSNSLDGTYEIVRVLTRLGNADEYVEEIARLLDKRESESDVDALAGKLSPNGIRRVLALMDGDSRALQKFAGYVKRAQRTDLVPELQLLVGKMNRPQEVLQSLLELEANR